MPGWSLNPDAGGVTIPVAVKQETKTRLLKHAERNYAGMYNELVIRFRGAFCYVDAIVKGDDTPLHLCRLRYFRPDHWSLGFFAYSSEKYELAVFPSGEFFGTPEEGLDVGAIYLTKQHT